MQREIKEIKYRIQHKSEEKEDIFTYDDISLCSFYGLQKALFSSFYDCNVQFIDSFISITQLFHLLSLKISLKFHFVHSLLIMLMPVKKSKNVNFFSLSKFNNMQLLYFILHAYLPHITSMIIITIIN